MDPRAEVNAVMRKLNESRLQERAQRACKACSQKHRKCEFKLNHYPTCDECSKKGRQCIFTANPPPPTRVTYPDATPTSSQRTSTDPRTLPYANTPSPTTPNPSQIPGPYRQSDVVSSYYPTLSDQTSGSVAPIQGRTPEEYYASPSNSYSPQWPPGNTGGRDTAMQYPSSSGTGQIPPDAYLRNPPYPSQSALSTEGTYPMDETHFYPISPQGVNTNYVGGTQQYHSSFTSSTPTSSGDMYYQQNPNQ
ncbi:hypothetical protein PNOK_0341900 [Pyrrhoderma noxium]|uniref:Zn(2)-C6 fungal-type domain-containing protein n=1 Tax=Pyrrhoderma noxium TaxID=2282107 RepID=A0A286UMK0_9AGAM|nr:hypothetical protein PNOK_0341900 [Pyrrhoderma noxium]